MRKYNHNNISSYKKKLIFIKTIRYIRILIILNTVFWFIVVGSDFFQKFPVGRSCLSQLYTYRLPSTGAKRHVIIS